MMIGGIDIIVPVPPRIPAAEVVEIVLRTMRRVWPTSLFVDAEEVAPHPISSPWVAARGGQSREFLIYRDRDAVSSWQGEGPTPENGNAMLHFLYEDDRDEAHELTLVCDERSGGIEQLASDLAASFQDAFFANSIRMAA